MTPDLLTEILIHCARVKTEACGLLISAPGGLAKFVPCWNIADEPETHFKIDPEDWERAEDAGRILGVVHSHPGGTTAPGAHDLASQAATRLPWWIVVPETGEWKRFGDSPLIGRTFAWGVEDCFSTLRDALGIEFDTVREPHFWHRSALFIDNLEAAGFAIVDGPAETGDVLLFAKGSTAINHCAAYLGGDEMIHHQGGRLSTREPVGRWWKHLVKIARRKA